MSSVLDFGARGDGQTDDTAALQHALDDGDGQLELPRGTYLITRSLRADLGRRGPLAIHGSHGTARLIMAGPGPALLLAGNHHGSANPATVKEETWQTSRLPMVADLEIVGRHPEADGIRLQHTMQATLRGLLVRRCRYGIHLAERNRNVVISHCHVYDCLDTGVFFDRCNLHQVIVADNHISYCRRAGIRQQDGDVHNIQISGNDIEYNSGWTGEPAETTGEIVLAAPEAVVSEYTIANNTIQATLDAGGANIVLIGPQESPPTGIRLVTISGNVLGSRRCNLIVRHGSRIAVTGNTIYGAAEASVRLLDSAYCVFQGNTWVSRPGNWSRNSHDTILFERCQACSLSGSVLNECGGGDLLASITLRQCRDITISENQILNPPQIGIQAVGSQFCRLAGNSIRAESRSRMTAAIQVSEDCRAMQIHQNVVSAGTEGAVVCPPQAGSAAENYSWD